MDAGGDRMRYRQWLRITLGIIMVLLFSVAGFNAWMDPLWTFDHAHRYNGIQAGFNERQQKTNHLTFTRQPYRTLVLGSSRVTYMDQHRFAPGPAYNYAVNNMLPWEYKDYVDYAVRRNGQEFEVIYVGLDFYATNRHLELPHPFEEPLFYIQAANRWGYRYWNLLSYDTLRYSRQNLEASRAGQPVNFAYTRRNVKTLQPTTPEDKEKRVAANLQWYGQEAYGEDYEYQNVARQLKELRDRYPNTRWVFFTTPVAEPLYQKMVESGRRPDYQRWIRDCVEELGPIYDFMSPNSVTRDLNYFYDASHVYPQVGNWVAHRVSGIDDPTLPDDFGVLVTRANLHDHLRSLP